MEEEDEYGDDDERRLNCLSHVIASSGDRTPSRSDLDERSILTADAFNGDPHSEDKGKYSRNETMPITRRYHDSVEFPTLWSKTN
jgi:hypothetical protein